MANFSNKQVQGNWGEWVPVLDGTVSFTNKQVQGVGGFWGAVLDGLAGAGTAIKDVISSGIIPFSR